MPSKKNRKRKLPSIAKLRKYVRERYFNRYIRLRDSVNGYITCVTCGAVVHWKEANAGHWRHGLDFVEDNQHGQCVKCNLWNSGMLDKYTLWMIDKYGRQRVDDISRMDTKYSRTEIQEISLKYQKKIREMERSRYDEPDSILRPPQGDAVASLAHEDYKDTGTQLPEEDDGRPMGVPTDIRL